MTKLRLKITKGEAIRYISHLDYARAIERALRRAKLPVAYSEGFNPHMKMAFASALSLGVTSEAEYLDIELKEDLPAVDFAKALASRLPEGIEIKEVQGITGNQASLMAQVNLAVYRLNLPLVGGRAAFPLGEASIQCFNAADQVLYIKENPKGRREIDVKCYISQVSYAMQPSAELVITIKIKITPTGSIKPSEVLSVLIDQYGLPGDRAAALIHRTGLYVTDEQRTLSPLEL